MTKKGRKNLLITLISVFAIVIALVFSLNFILGNVLRNVIDDQLMAMNEKAQKQISVGKVRLNVFSRTVTIKNINIVPNSNQVDSLKRARLEQESIMEINIPVLKLMNINILELITERKLLLKQILLKGVKYTVYKSDYKVNIEEGEDAPVSVNLAHIKGLNGIEIGKVIVEDYIYTTVNVKSNDTIFSFNGSNFEIKGLEFEGSDKEDGFYFLDKDKLLLKMRRQRLVFKDSDYFVFIKELDLSMSDEIIKVKDLKIKPISNRLKLAASYKYSTELLDVDLKSLIIYGYRIEDLLKQGIIGIDSVLLDGLSLDVYRDRSIPFDLNRRPLFIQQHLKNLKQPLHISKLKIRNSKFVYQMRIDDLGKMLHIDIDDMAGDISFITSMEDSLRSGKRLRINVKGQLMGATAISLNVIMPYDSPVDTFYFSGTLGSANFENFNSVLYPAIGTKFVEGRLKSMKFYANASPKGAKGLMTMLYNGLKAELTKKDKAKKSKLFSFGANSVLRDSNPSSKGKTRIALIKFDRVEYKGFGNLLWKSVQSGMVRTMLPMGKSHDLEKVDWRHKQEIEHEEGKSSSNGKKKKWWKKK